MKTFSFFNNGFILFLLSAAIVAIGAPLMQKGVFIDAMLYKTVAFNFASGDSSFWRMKFTDVSMNPFYEQPPLYFGLLGTWYKIFGQGLITDRAFTLLCLVISVLLLRRICSRFFKANVAGTVCFFMLCIPVIHWTFVNQAIETIVTPLTLFAFLLATNRGSSARAVVLNGTGLGCVLVLLFLSKGFQSCFVIVSPFIYFFVRKEKSLLWTGMVASLVLTVSLYVLLFVYQPSAAWFNVYLEKRLTASLAGVGATTTYRAEILIRIITEMILPLLMVLAAIWFYRKKSGTINEKQDRSKAWIFLLTGLCGTVPYAITLEQRGFYLVPAFPFLVLALVAFAEKPISYFQTMIVTFFERRGPAIVLMILFLFSFAYMVYSPVLYKREEVMLTDLEKMKPFFKSGDTIAIDAEMWNFTSVHAVLYLQNQVNLSQLTLHRYYLHDDAHQTPVKPGYEKIPLETREFQLYKKVE